LTCDGRLPLDEQLARFEQTLRRNRTLTEVLARAATLDLPGWYLVAGCLCQTVWNVASGQPPEEGILGQGRTLAAPVTALTILPWLATA
jgi:hypothetical protein